MIIARAPLRISLGGGGTDLPSYYQDHESCFISAAINKYIYISMLKTFTPEIKVRYSENESTTSIDEIAHPIVREVFKSHNVKEHVELVSQADIPAGTGLGSSGTFTVAVLKALYAFKRHHALPHNIAEEACDIEIKKLKRSCGKQDQYIAAFGGITVFNIDKKGNVTASPLHITQETLEKLEDNLLLFFTGYSRAANSILAVQDTKTKGKDDEMVKNLHFMKELGVKSKDALEAGDLKEFARLMNVHWEHKKKRADAMSNDKIDEWYKIAMANGALGGKLIGAGGGGFLMFYTEDKDKLVAALTKAGMQHIRFGFDFDGAKVIVNE